MGIWDSDIEVLQRQAFREGDIELGMWRTEDVKEHSNCVFSFLRPNMASIMFLSLFPCNSVRGL